MYLGVDIGGTKTLAATLDDTGVIVDNTKFPTPQNYQEFLAELAKVVDSYTTKDFKAAGVGMPVTVFDRQHGIGRVYGNLDWKDVPIQSDLEQLFNCPIALENDAKLAGLSEAMLLKDYSKVLYVTISTGIGTALVVDQKIDTNVGDSGGRAILLEHHGKLVPWESFASGHAIVERFGKRAEEITDEGTWKRIVHDWRDGFIELIAIMAPDVIVIGGSVGTYFERYHKLLVESLKAIETPYLIIPDFVQAQRPEEAVVYGAYDLAKQVYSAKNA